MVACLICLPTTVNNVAPCNHGFLQIVVLKVCTSDMLACAVFVRVIDCMQFPCSRKAGVNPYQLIKIYVLEVVANMVSCRLWC